jgi:hypothetical protein
MMVCRFFYFNPNVCMVVEMIPPRGETETMVALLPVERDLVPGCPASSIGERLRPAQGHSRVQAVLSSRPPALGTLKWRLSIGDDGWLQADGRVDEKGQKTSDRPSVANVFVDA